MAELKLELIEPIECRIEEFKKDPQKMKDVNEFLTELFEQARTEAEHRSAKQGKSNSFGLPNGTRRIGAWSNRARTSARTFATRVFTAICNCTNTVKSVVVNRN